MGTVFSTWPNFDPGLWAVIGVALGAFATFFLSRSAANTAAKRELQAELDRAAAYVYALLQKRWNEWKRPPIEWRKSCALLVMREDGPRHEAAVFFLAMDEAPEGKSKNLDFVDGAKSHRDALRKQAAK